MAEPATLLAVVAAAFLSGYAKDIASWLLKIANRILKRLGIAEAGITIHMKDGQEFKIPTSDLKAEDTAKILNQLKGGPKRE
jgi:hypothetical protein